MIQHTVNNTTVNNTIHRHKHIRLSQQEPQPILPGYDNGFELPVTLSYSSTKGTPLGTHAQPQGCIFNVGAWNG